MLAFSDLDGGMDGSHKIDDIENHYRKEICKVKRTKLDTAKK
jgi:hypothetical protein